MLERRELRVHDLSTIVHDGDEFWIFFNRNRHFLFNDGGTLLLAPRGDFIGRGHPSIFPYRGTDWLSVHFCDGATENGTSMLGMAAVEWDSQGRPVVVPAP